jgi:hypothetical protein
MRIPAVSSFAGCVYSRPRVAPRRPTRAPASAAPMATPLHACGEPSAPAAPFIPEPRESLPPESLFGVQMGLQEPQVLVDFAGNPRKQV